MRGKIGLAVLLLSVLFWAPGIRPLTAQLAASRARALEPPRCSQPASVTVPPEAPVVVANAAAANSRGWSGSDWRTDTSRT